MEKLKLVDKYISTQVIEAFILGMTIFTSIMFASDAFLNLFKQISMFGISFKVALLLIILKLPTLIVFTIPMAVLLATIVTVNKLNTSLEISIFRACGISIARLSKPIFIVAIAASLFSFGLNEFIVPAANQQAKILTIWALSQNHIPKGKTNFSFKELDSNNKLKRLFYIDKCKGKNLEGITVLDLSKNNTTQIIQSKFAQTYPDHWTFNKGVVYTISKSNKVMNTMVFGSLNLFSDLNLTDKNFETKPEELNFINLKKYIDSKNLKKDDPKNYASMILSLNEKFAFPLTSIFLTFIGIPLSITKPRSRFNRGFLFSILVIFCYYLIRALSVSIGEGMFIDPVLAAWLPNIIFTTIGGVMFYRKAFLV